MTTTTHTLTSWLLDRIAEDEAAVRVFVNDLGQVRRWRADEVGPIVRRVRTPPFGLPDVEATGASHMEAAHIARHDPARVLAEFAAKQAIVALHEDWDGTCSQCRGEERDEWDRAPYPCDTLRHLAAVYADAPGYDAAWVVS